MAKRRGAVVTATVSNDEKAALARSAGADQMILYGDPLENPYTDLYGTMHVVYDSVGRATFEESVKCLKDRGTVALYGTASGAVAPFDLERLSQGSYFVTRPILKHYTATTDELEWRAGEVFKAIAEAALHVLIGKTYPLEQAAVAQTDLESRRSFGKLVLVVADE